MLRKKSKENNYLTLPLFLFFILMTNTAVANGIPVLICQSIWNKGTSPQSFCQKEILPDNIDNPIELQWSVFDNLKSFIDNELPQGICRDSVEKTRLSRDIRKTCVTSKKLIELSTIWPLDRRMVRYLRNSDLEELEQNTLELLKSRYLDEPSDSKSSIIGWD